MKRDRESDDVENSKKHQKKIEYNEIYGNTLLEACRLGDLDVVQVLIRRGADVETRDEDMKRSALHLAAFCGYVDVVKVLIQKGADVNAVDEDKETALHWAAKNGRADVVKVLIQKGADVNAVNTHNTDAQNNNTEHAHISSQRSSGKEERTLISLSL